jgi:hypothetical protein
LFFNLHMRFRLWQVYRINCSLLSFNIASVHFGPMSMGELTVNSGRAPYASAGLHTPGCRLVSQRLGWEHITHVPFTPSARIKASHASHLGVGELVHGLLFNSETGQP